MNPPLWASLWNGQGEPDRPAIRCGDLTWTYDRLFLSGSFEGARVGVGVDLRTYELMLSVPGGRTELAEKLAGALSAQ